MLEEHFEHFCNSYFRSSSLCSAIDFIYSSCLSLAFSRDGGGYYLRLLTTEFSQRLAKVQDLGFGYVGFATVNFCFFSAGNLPAITLRSSAPFTISDRSPLVSEKIGFSNWYQVASVAPSSPEPRRADVVMFLHLYLRSQTF